MMLVSRPFYQRTSSPRSKGIRTPLKIPTYSFEKPFFDSEAVEHYRATSPFKSPIELSTPSPSATANGNIVDFEFEKFRRLSDDWLRNREIEESQNRVVNLNSRSPSPHRSYRSKSPSRSRSASPEKTNFRRSASPEKSYTQRSYRSIDSPERNYSANTTRSSISPEKNNYSNSYNRRSVSQERPSSARILLDRSPSPLRYSPLTKTFSRDNSSTPNNYTNCSIHSRSPSPLLSIPSYRRSSSYDSDSASSSKLVSASSPLFKRSNSYTPKEYIPSNFLRSRSASPNRLNPASSYFQKTSGTDDRDNNRISNYSRFPLSPKTNLNDIPENSYSKLKPLYGNSSSKFNTLPNSRYFSRRTSPGRDTFIGALFNDTPRKDTNYNSIPSTRRYENKYFLPNSIADLPPLKMSTSPRRFSEENHHRSLDDEMVARRRFSDDLKKRPYYTADILEEYYNQQRKLSEAGIRKVSDASLVLNEDTDSFIIGDRVWVGGTKPGVISYIGETQFAPGMWAGVTLDEAIGKNNGSVAGVRYFQCEDKKGVFSRLTRLSRSPLTEYDLEILLTSRASTLGSDSPRSTPAHSIMSGPTYGSGGRKITPTGIDTRKITPPPRVEAVRKPTPSAAFRKPTTPVSTRKNSAPQTPTSFDIRIGERVSIDSNAGLKCGVLRFYGKAEFADGVWAGVELDEPTGKNDGSVAGKKYFSCAPKHGLFAPVARVNKQSSSRRTSGIAVPSQRSSIPSMRRSNSRESLGGSSVASSTVSSLRGTRVRIGVTSLSPNQRPSKTSGYGMGGTSKALQETLAEKTQHVDQLMRERDLERSEVARMAAQLDEATQVAQEFKMQLDQLQIESEERLHDFGVKVQTLEDQKREIFHKLEDKQREIDDLSFRVEEETIAKADFESQNISDSIRVKELEGLLQKEKKKNEERGEKEADKVYEMEENELGLRSSVEELQAKVMELDEYKENTGKQLEELCDKVKKYETELSSQSIILKEKDQKLQLLESTKQENEELETKSKNTKMNQLEHDLEVTRNELEITAKSLSEVRDELQNISAQLKEEEDSKKDISNKVIDLEQNLESFSSNEKKLQSEILNLNEETKKLLDQLSEMKQLEELMKTKDEEVVSLKKDLSESSLKVNSLTDNKKRLEDQLESALSSSSNSTDEVSLLRDQLRQMETKMYEAQEAEKVASSRLHSEKESASELEIKMSGEIEKLKKELEEATNSFKTQQKELAVGKAEELKELSIKVDNLLEEKNNLLSKLDEQEANNAQLLKSKDEQHEILKEENLRSQASEVADLKKLISDSEIKLESTIESKNRLEQQLESVLSSSSSTSDQVSNLTDQLKNMESQMSEAIESKKILNATLTSNAEAHAEEIKRLELEKQNLEMKFEKDVSALKVDVNSLKEANESSKENLNDQINQLQNQKENLLTKVNELEKNHKNTMESLQEQHKNSDAAATLASSTTIKELKNELSECKIKLESLTENKKRLEDQLESALSSSSNSSEEVTIFREKLQKMETKAYESQESEKILEAKLKSQEKHYTEELTKAAEETTKLRLKSETDISTITVELQTLKEQKVTMEEHFNLKLEEINQEKKNLLAEIKEEKLKLTKLSDDKQRETLRSETLEAEISDLQEKLKSFDINSQNLLQLKEEHDAIKQQFSSLQKEKLNDLSKSQENELKIKENLQIITKEKEAINEEKLKLDEECCNLKSSLETCKQEKLNNDKEKSILESDLSTLQSIKEDYSSSLETIRSLKENNKKIEEESLILSAKVNEFEILQKEKTELDSKVLLLSESVQLIQEKLGSQIRDLETEKKNLVDEVVIFQDEISKLKDELKAEMDKPPPLPPKMRDDRRSSERESAELRLKLLSMESEKRKLETEVKEWKEKSLISGGNDQETNDFIIQLKNERDQFEGQVHFLNSVIVDMQQKREDLQSRLELLQMGNVPDDEKANICTSQKKVIAPRLFCDICDCFDLHDTEDCPTQATSSDSPPQSNYHGDRTAQRPFCELCEVFGHVAGECPEDDTF